MTKNYVYRIDHDTGFAPNIEYGICSLSGCKKNTIENWARRGRWVIGIGGNSTGKPDKLIYAMEVEENLSYAEFVEKYPQKSKYLHSDCAGSNVLVSKKSYYFGDHAIDLPEFLGHIIIRRRGCKCVSDEDIQVLKKYLSRGFAYGYIWQS